LLIFAIQVLVDENAVGGEQKRELAALSPDLTCYAPIKFDEIPKGSDVTSQYRTRGIKFGGVHQVSGLPAPPFTTNDPYLATSPVLSGQPLMGGKVIGTFVVPSSGDSPLTVDGFSIVASTNGGGRHPNEIGTVAIRWYDADDNLVGQITNKFGNGIGNVSVEGGNVAKFTVEIYDDDVKYGETRYSIDDVVSCPIESGIIFREVSLLVCAFCCSC